MPKRRPSHVVYTRTVYYGHGRRPRTKRVPWRFLGIGVGIVLLVVAPEQTLRFLVLIGIGWVLWRALKKIGAPL